MKVSLPIILFPLFTVVHAIPGHGIGLPIRNTPRSLELPEPAPTYENRNLTARALDQEIGDKSTCVDIGYADGSEFSNFCSPPHKCYAVVEKAKQIKYFHFKGSTVCSLYSGCKDCGNSCVGKSWDFQESDPERLNIPQWWQEHGVAFDCYRPN